MCMDDEQLFYEFLEERFEDSQHADILARQFVLDEVETEEEWISENSKNT